MVVARQRVVIVRSNESMLVQYLIDTATTAFLLYLATAYPLEIHRTSLDGRIHDDGEHFSWQLGFRGTTSTIMNSLARLRQYVGSDLTANPCRARLEGGVICIPLHVYKYHL